jgi:hypothetical protein
LTTSQAQPVSVPPIEVVALMMTMEMIPAMRPYSIAVAPLSSARKALSPERARR